MHCISVYSEKLTPLLPNLLPGSNFTTLGRSHAARAVVASVRPVTQTMWNKVCFALIPLSDALPLACSQLLAVGQGWKNL